MCLMAKDQSFHIQSESARFQKLSAVNTARWMIATVKKVVKGNFKKVNSFATDTCNLKRAVWDIIQEDPRFRHVFFVPCDSHGL